MNASYYALVQSDDDGGYSAWIPDIPGITAAGPSEKEAIRELSRCARRYLQEIDEKGLPRPTARGLDQLVSMNTGNHYRCVLLVLTTRAFSRPTFMDA